ncbi:MAG: hypothetical protein WKG07_23950 [Hymenobacter sp.]
MALLLLPAAKALFLLTSIGLSVAPSARVGEALRLPGGTAERAE